MKTTRKTLDILVKSICDKTNQANSSEKAVQMGLKEYAYLEYASIYGGYRLVNVNIDNGSHNGFMDMGCIGRRLKASEMEIQLRGILTGLKWGGL